VLAVAVGPLALVTLRRALRQQYRRHRQIARVTLPIWLYVVVTGWTVYLCSTPSSPSEGRAAGNASPVEDHLARGPSVEGEAGPEEHEGPFARGRTAGRPSPGGRGPRRPPPRRRG